MLRDRGRGSESGVGHFKHCKIRQDQGADKTEKMADMAEEMADKTEETLTLTRHRKASETSEAACSLE